MKSEDEDLSEAPAECEAAAMRADLMRAQESSLLRVWEHPDDAVWDLGWPA